MIKQKIAKCKDCPPEAEPGPVTAGRCRTHYWKHRQKVNTSKPRNVDKRQRQDELKTYFANQTIMMPELCEESGQPLPRSPAWLKKACIAHILPKRPDVGFPSVATHPQNRVFLDPDIHTDMDNFGESYVMKMKCLPLMRDRVKVLLPLLTPEELRRVPEYLLDNHNCNS
jgi:hypothetical protein